MSAGARRVAYDFEREISNVYPTTEYVGFACGPGFLRAYDLPSLDPGACPLADSCGSVGRLQGTT